MSNNLSNDLSNNLAGGAVSFESILGANLAEIWLPEGWNISGNDVLDITGSLQDKNIPNVVDPCFHLGPWAPLGGKPAFRCVPGVSAMRSAGFGNVSDGTLPFVWLICDVRGSTPNANVRFAQVRDDAFSFTNDVEILADNTLRAGSYNATHGTRYSGGVASLTGAAILGSVIEPSGAIRLWRNGVLDAAGSLAIPATSHIEAMSVGCGHSGGQMSLIDVAVAGICHAPPTAAALDALYAFAQAEYGVP